jgi:hypothetical protein
MMQTPDLFNCITAGTGRLEMGFDTPSVAPSTDTDKTEGSGELRYSTMQV